MHDAQWLRLFVSSARNSEPVACQLSMALGNYDNVFCDDQGKQRLRSITGSTSKADIDRLKKMITDSALTKLDYVLTPVHEDFLRELWYNFEQPGGDFDEFVKLIRVLEKFHGIQ